MTEADIESLVGELAPVIKRYVQKAVDQLSTRIQQLETQPQLRYMGVWHGGVEYKQGNFATHEGAVWHCNVAAKGVAPGTASAVWTLAVKSSQR